MTQYEYDVMLYLMPIFLSLMVTLGLSLLAYSRREMIGARYFSVLLLLEASWTFGYIFSLLSPSLEGKIFWDNFQYIGTLLMPPIMLAFALTYCNRKNHYAWPVWVGFILPAGVGIFLVYSNPWFHLAYLNPRLIQVYPFNDIDYSINIPLYPIFFFSYGLMLWGNYLLFKLFLKQKNLYRQQTGVILIGTLLPILGSLSYFVDLPFIPHGDLSPYYFAIADLFIAYGLFRLRVFDIVPIGRSMVVGNMRDGVLITDETGHLADINQAARILMKQPDLVATGQPISDLPTQWAEYLQINPEDCQTQLKEFVLVDEQGGRYFELDINRILNHRGRFSGYILMLREVSQRKKAELDLQTAYNEMENRVKERTLELSQTIKQLQQEITERQVAEAALQHSEARFQSIIEQSSEGFLLVDNEGRIVENNPAMEKITAIPCSEMKGRYVWDFQSEIALRGASSSEMEKRFEQIFEVALQSKESPFFKRLFEVRIITRGGEQKVIQQVTFPVITGTTTHLGTLIRDVTSQKETEAELQKLNNELENRVAERTEQLENINQELESFSYSVSHDLRAPLRSINGFASALMEDVVEVLSEEDLGYINRILVNTRRMDELINALLNLSRLGRKPLERQQVNTSQIIYGAWKEVQHEAGERAIRITIDAPPDCMADAVLLKQVYVNLLSNAVKYTRLQSEAEISVGWGKKDQDIVYWVKDNGAGFDMQYAENLFGIFQRLHREDQFEGTGVGLTIVQRIIHRHGGQIWAEALPDQGATFYFTLS